MKYHKNLKSLLTDFANDLSTASRSRMKTTTGSFIDNFISENSCNIDADNELLNDLNSIKLLKKPLVYTQDCMDKDRRLLENIINNVKHNNYRFVAIQKIRRFK